MTSIPSHGGSASMVKVIGMKDWDSPGAPLAGGCEIDALALADVGWATIWSVTGASGTIRIR